jgi:methylmalonyl-CoA mutase cobalamin-binding subunit
VIRAWERRYGVVAPTRGPRGARLYSAGDVAQLQLLRRAVASGRAIGDIARMSRSALQALVDAPAMPVGRLESAAPNGEILGQAVGALERFDWGRLDRCLGDALVALGARDFVAHVATPLMIDVGDRWSDGRLSVADEHLVSGLMHNVLAGVLRSRARTAQPTVLLATAAGERHELGLLMAGLVIAEVGCGICYLGVDLPAAEVAAAARRSQAAVVGLGVANGESLDASVAELRRVERDLPAGSELWIGGRMARAAAAELGGTRAVVIDEIAAIEKETARLRAQRPGQV